jgi:hypothetical protein
MSYPYPQNRRRDQREKGEHPYKDAKEAMATTDAQLQADAEAHGETHRRTSEEERAARFEAEAEARLRHAGDEVAAAAEDRLGEAAGGES